MKLTKLVMTLAVALDLSGCGVYMAAHQPEKKNLGLFAIGTSHDQLLAEFGEPSLAETRDGHRYEVYKFQDGYERDSRTARAVFHGVVDIITMGLWEVIATPTEIIYDGTAMAYGVRLDDHNKVDEVAVLKEPMPTPPGTPRP